MAELSAHLDITAADGPDIFARRAGVYKALSSLVADRLSHIHEAWGQWQASSAMSAKTNPIDLNAEFDVQNTGTLLVNSAVGIGTDISQSGLAAPSIFPMTASAVALRAQSGSKGVALGVFDALTNARHDPRKLALR